MDKTDLTSADLVWDVCPLCPVFVGKLSAGDAAGVILIAVGKMRFFVVDPQDPFMEPYYVIMRLPEGDKEEFILILPFTPANKDNMIAWMAARGICTDV